MIYESFYFGVTLKKIKKQTKSKGQFVGVCFT